MIIKYHSAFLFKKANVFTANKRFGKRKGYVSHIT